jgi:hypothetical protein
MASRESHPDIGPSHGVQFGQLPPMARHYVSNLLAQRDEVFHRAGLPKGTTMGTITPEDARRLSP